MKTYQNIIYILIAGFVVLISLIKGINSKMNDDSTQGIKIWSPRIPFSTDPLDYDALAHHICFRSVYSSLVTDYKLGDISGQIASGWNVNDDKTVWSFEIRDNIYFSNGKLITPLSVAQSLNRAAYLMKIKNSNAGVLEFLVDFNKILNPIQTTEGISFGEKRITLKFIKPMPDLLQKISFGLYAVVSTDDFDNKTGEWLDKKKITSSGPYEIIDWNSSSLVLALKNNYPKNLMLKNPIVRAIFVFDEKSISNSDILIDFDDSLSIGAGYRFFGPAKSAIRYVECEGWNNAGSVCHNIVNRRKLRSLFYEYMDSTQFKIVNSFFPLAINGVKEIKPPLENLSDINANSFQKIKISKVNNAFKNEENKDITTPQEAFENAMKYTAEKYKTDIEIVSPSIDSTNPSPVDIRFRMTAILVDAPRHDIEFMFLSDRGIKLADSNGEIKKYLKSEPDFSVQRINEKLVDQAIVWPIGHMSLGVWAKENRGINLKSYNSILPPLDLQWIEME